MSSPLLASAERRWAQISAEHPSLAMAVALQRSLLSGQVDLLERASAGVRAAEAPLPAEVAAALGDGRTAFTCLGPRPAGAPLEDAFRDALRRLAGTAAAKAAARLEQTLLTRDIDVPALLSATVHRDQEPSRAVAAEHGVNLQVLWFASELATAPLAHAWQARLLGVTPPAEPLRDAVDRWQRGTCPACGSPPALAEFFHGQRLNRCAYCAATWPLSAGCTFCGTTDARFRTIVPDQQRPGRRLELCRACGGYLKTIDVGLASPFPLVAVEDLASSDLDRAAQHHGFRRSPAAERS